MGGVMPLAVLLWIVLIKEDVFESWMLYPLSIIPTGGTLGGILFYWLGFHFFPKFIKSYWAFILSALIYFGGIWMSAVIAFNFTGHWN